MHNLFQYIVFYYFGRLKKLTMFWAHWQ